MAGLASGAAEANFGSLRARVERQSNGECLLPGRALGALQGLGDFLRGRLLARERF